MLPLRGGLAPLTLATYIPVASWWLSGGISAANAIAAYAPKGAASLAASYTNLANPGTYNAAPGTAPTWDATNGWKFLAASTQYLRTGITPTAGWTFIVRFSNVGNGATLIGFGSVPTTRLYMYPADGTSLYLSNGDSASSVAGQSMTSGVLALSGVNAYKNGSSVATLTAWTKSGLEVFIGARNNGTSADAYMTAYIQSMAVYNTTLTAAQVLAVTNAMNAL